MLHLILMLALSPIQPVKTANVTTCQWPHRCDVVAQVTTCQWPHRCAATEPSALDAILPITGPCAPGRVCAGAA